MASSHPDRSTFVLIHGAWHGAWCWRPLEHELRLLGHHTVAMDLPAGEPDAGLDRYADVVVQAAEREDRGDVVVVAHSLGGLVAPLVADRLGARAVLYVAALVPVPGLSFEEQVGRDGGQMFAASWSGLAARQQTAGGASWWEHADAIEAFFHDCASRTAESAARSLRPQHWELTRQPCPLADVASVPSAAVLCRADRAVDADWIRQTANDVFAAEAIELPGGHSPMLARPRALAEVLGDTAAALMAARRAPSVDEAGRAPASLQRAGRP